MELYFALEFGSFQSEKRTLSMTKGPNSFIQKQERRWKAKDALEKKSIQKRGHLSMKNGGRALTLLVMWPLMGQIFHEMAFMLLS